MVRSTFSHPDDGPNRNRREGPVDHSVRHFVFLIHGTWGRASDGWYRPSKTEGRFADRLAAAFKGTPLAGAVWRDTEIFEWSGDNTHAARLEAAQQLAVLLFKIRNRNPAARFHFVAHSHGGNVVLRAILNYLLDLPTLRLNQFGFPHFVTDDKTRREFFSAADRFIEFWNAHHGRATIPCDTELIEDARQWVKDLNQVSRKFAAGNAMILRLAYLLLRLGPHPEEHGISSVVFMGTPFYYKRWKPSRHLLGRSAAGVAQSLLVGLAVYVALVLGGVLLAAVSTVPGPGTNPLDWHRGLRLALSTMLVWSWARGFRAAIITIDTNVYFDERFFDRRAGTTVAFGELKDRVLFNALVISSGFLDEALASLASIPWLFQRALPVLTDGFLAPLKWDYTLVPETIGRVRGGVDMVIIQPLLGVAGRVLAGLKWLLYPVRVFVYRLFTRPLALSQAARVSLPLAYGLPPQEFGTGEIRVSKDLDIGHIRVLKIDVARDLVTARTSPDRAATERFEFLWDDEALAERWAGSMASRQFGGHLSSETQRNLLAVEERLRELYGVAGVRHSLYYENPKVLETIAEYLIANSR